MFSAQIFKLYEFFKETIIKEIKTKKLLKYRFFKLEELFIVRVPLHINQILNTNNI